MSHGLSDPEIIAGGTRLFQQFYNIPDEDLEEALKNYQGFDLEGESEELCKMMRCNPDYSFVEPQPDDIDINTVHFDSRTLDSSSVLLPSLRLGCCRIVGKGEYHQQ